jgi:6-phosphogluconolactonase
MLTRYQLKQKYQTINLLNCLTTGGSLPNFFVSAVKDLGLDWSRIKFIFCDERLVPDNDPESTFGVYKEKLIGKVTHF